MPFNFRLNLQDVFRRLGIQSGARLPKLEDDVRMTMQVTDLSRLIPAPIEPRGYAGTIIPPPAGLQPIAQLQALSAGGVFIEIMFLRGQGFTNLESFFINVSNQDLGLPLSNLINIGGRAIRSRFTAGSAAAGAGGPFLPAPEGLATLPMQVGIFVPNQSFFSITHNRPLAILDVGLIFRELPSIEEVG